MVETLDEIFNDMAAPGSVWLTTGFKGGGKSHTAIAVAEQFVKGRYPSLGRVFVITNMIFFHKVGGKILEETPHGVYHVCTMKELFPLVAQILEANGKKARILLILDEAQNFIGGDSNQSNASVMMKEFLGTIRKFRMIVWFLTPSAKSIGPAFRNFINDSKYPGNLTAMWKKDLAHNKKYIKEHNLSWDPKELMMVMNYDMEQPVFFRVPVTEWTKTREDLNEDEYCYDHEASATFYVGEGFDWNLFNRKVGGVSSMNVLREIKTFYKNVKMDEDWDPVKTDAPKEYKMLVCRRAVEIAGLDLKVACKIVNVPYSTMRRWLKDAGIKLNFDADSIDMG
ncbi:hypothetical protein [Candidatus Methanarcanum hacksteinii]|uniref:hypothetical protein n=1 Tax=Candidatus Methanarcanum hacksteinii TaxID=2911857 RepID=UPI0037DD0CB8